MEIKQHIPKTPVGQRRKSNEKKTKNNLKQMEMETQRIRTLSIVLYYMHYFDIQHLIKSEGEL